MKAIISGYYGFGNIGDEAVLKAIIEGFNKYYPTVQLTVLSSAPQFTEEINQVRAVSRNISFGLVKEIWETDLLISGGGSLFQDTTSKKSFFYYIGLVFLAKLFGKKVIVFGQGIGPLRSNLLRHICKWVLNSVDLITLRDHGSLNELQSIGVTRPKTYVTADLVFTLSVPSNIKGEDLLKLDKVSYERKLLGISVRDIPSEKDNRPYEIIAEAIDLLIQKYNYYPVFMGFKLPEDADAAAKVISHMKNDSAVIFRNYSPDEMLSVFSLFSAFLGMRLHSLVFALINLVPMVGISYDPKVKAFMESAGSRYFPVNALEASKIVSAYDDLKPEEKNRNKKNELSEKAWLNFTLLRELIK